MYYYTARIIGLLIRQIHLKIPTLLLAKKIRHTLALHSNSASKDIMYTASIPGLGKQAGSALPHQHYSMGASNIMII
jgi:hypothetical protein